MIKLQVITRNDKILLHTALFLFNYWEHICNSWSAHNDGMTLQPALEHMVHTSKDFCKYQMSSPSVMEQAVVLLIWLKNLDNGWKLEKSV